MQSLATFVEVTGAILLATSAVLAEVGDRRADITMTPSSSSAPVAFTAARKLLRYSVDEERSIGTVIAENLASDAGFHGTADVLEFILLNSQVPSITSSGGGGSTFQALFQLDRRTGCLRTAVVIDREAICRQQLSCVITLDVALQPAKYFEIIKVEVTIVDINDNGPVFSPSRLTVSVSEATSAPRELFAIMPATDADSPLNGIVGYRLISLIPDSATVAADNSLFGLIVNSTAVSGSWGPSVTTTVSTVAAVDRVRLALLRPLDYETTDIHHLQLIAFDSAAAAGAGQPSLTGTLYIDVLVTDYNDNAPRFDNASYTANIWETANSQSTVTRVHATDLDSPVNGRIQYRFSKRTVTASGNAFSIDSDSGIIRLLVDGRQLNQTTYNLAVIADDQAIDNPMSAMVSVTINILDVNEHPPSIVLDVVNNNKLSSDSDVIDVIEHGRVNTTVAMMTATDADRGVNGRVHCFLKSDGNGMFNDVQLFDSVYKIVNTRPFDIRTQSVYELGIECRDGGHVTSLTSTRNVTVYVRPAGPNVPVFTQPVYLATLTEHSPPGTTVLQAFATDRNIQRNAPIKYSIEDSMYNLFAINDDTGVIIVRNPVDREAVGNRLEFHVFATVVVVTSITDVTSCSLIRLTILDIDDNIPQFAQTHFSFSVLENVTVGSFVGQVNASDIDDNQQFNQFRYSINTSPFVINSVTGDITTSQPLDYEAISKYDFLVNVAAFSDLATIAHSSHVTIDVIDVNDNHPVFRFPSATNNTLRLRHTAPVGTVVARLIATDRDSNANANLTYFIDNTTSLVRVMPSSGLLVIVASNLSTYRHLTRHVTVYVMDSGSPRLTSSALLHISIVDNSEPIDYIRANYDVINTTADNTPNHVHVIGLAALCGCVVVVGVCSLVAVLVNKRASVRTVSVSGKSHCSRNVVWRKVASSDVVESPLYVATAAALHKQLTDTASTPATTANTTSLQPEGPDIILTLDSEPVNYATRQRHLLNSSTTCHAQPAAISESHYHCDSNSPKQPYKKKLTSNVEVAEHMTTSHNGVINRLPSNGHVTAMSNGYQRSNNVGINNFAQQQRLGRQELSTTNIQRPNITTSENDCIQCNSIDRTKRVHFANHNLSFISSSLAR